MLYIEYFNSVHRLVLYIVVVQNFSSVLLQCPQVIIIVTVITQSAYLDLPDLTSSFV